MSDKTTEEAAELSRRAEKYYFSEPLVRQLPIMPVMLAYKAGAASLSTTIAQLREENERLKGGMKQARGHLTNLQLHIEQLERRHRLFIDTDVDMAIEVMSQALTPKLPKTDG